MSQILLPSAPFPSVPSLQWDTDQYTFVIGEVGYCDHTGPSDSEAFGTGLQEELRRVWRNSL